MCRKGDYGAGVTRPSAHHQITPRWREEGLLDSPAECQRVLLVAVRSPMTVTTGSSSLPKHVSERGLRGRSYETQQCEPPNHSALERRGTLRFAGRMPTNFVGCGAFTSDCDDWVLLPPQACVGKGIRGQELRDPAVRTTKSLHVGEKRDS
jgi:hypothetical protein